MALDMIDLLNGDPLQDKMIRTLILDDNDFVFDKIAPRMGMPKRQSKIQLFGKNDKITNTSFRKDNEAAKEGDDIDTKEIGYNCEAIDERKFIPNSILNHGRISGSVIREIYVEKLAMKQKIRREKMLADKITNVDNYASTNKEAVGSGDKFTSSSSKPVKYILGKAKEAKKRTGLLMDSIFFSYESWDAFLNNPNVVAMLPNNYFGVVTVDMIMPLLKSGALSNLKNVYIGAATYDSNTKKPERTGEFIFADDVVLFRKAVPIEEQLADPGFLLNVESEDPDDFGVLNYKDESKKTKGEWIENRLSFDLMACGYNDPFEYAYLLKGTN